MSNWMIKHFGILSMLKTKRADFRPSDRLNRHSFEVARLTRNILPCN